MNTLRDERYRLFNSKIFKSIFLQTKYTNDKVNPLFYNEKVKFYIYKFARCSTGTIASEFATSLHW